MRDFVVFVVAGVVVINPGMWDTFIRTGISYSCIFSVLDIVLKSLADSAAAFVARVECVSQGLCEFPGKG